jgi:predicted Zn-dependent protease
VLLVASLQPVGMAGAAAQVNLPALGDASDDFGVGAERRLGDRIMREVRRDPAYLDDPQLGEYLQTLWQPLVAAARRKGEITPDLDARLAWEAFLVRDRSVNAFALPGGFVGVHLGLIALTQSRDELASVLAHELTHVTQRHIARGFANSRRQSLIAVAGMILGLLAASRANSGDAASAAIAGSQAVAIQGELNFSRDMEREADRIGFALMSEAGFSPAGMAMMFERLGAASRLNDSGGFPYLRTHPLTVERIGEARARTGGPGPVPAPRSGGLAPIDARNLAFEHAAAMARSRVMMDPREEALRRWQPVALPGAASPGAAAAAGGGGAEPGPGANAAAGAASVAGTAPPSGAGDPALERFAALLASAQASTLLRDWARADAALTLARAGLASSPRSLPAASRALTLLAAESQIARGDGARAIELLAPLLEGESRAVALLHAEALIAWTAAPAPALRQRAESLQTWASAHPDDALAWQALGRLWARLDQPLRALRAEAETRYALGDLAGASDRLRAGQRLARQQPERARGEFIEASVIDARLREVDAQRRQIFLEERGGPLPP